jgi:hypothetical protein
MAYISLTWYIVIIVTLKWAKISHYGQKTQKKYKIKTNNFILYEQKSKLVIKIGTRNMFYPFFINEKCTIFNIFSKKGTTIFK